MPTPAPPPKPSTPAPHATPAPKTAVDTPTPPLPIGAKPLNPEDPQAVKFDPPQPAPPRWEDPPHEPGPLSTPAWTPKAAIDPLAEKPPKGVYLDGMPVADEQRARAAWVEQNGLMKYDEEIDERQGEKPQFDKAALAGGGAFVSAGAQAQVAGVTPPTKRS